MIQWIEFLDVGFAGLLFKRLHGRTANLTRNPALLEQLIELADRLHKDEEIRSRLKASAREKSYLNYFVETYIDRFTADLEVVAASQPPFVSSTLLTWMQEETDRLREAASRMRPFHSPAIEAVHGDLNEGNVFITPDNWFVLDWDDLALGDPAVDFSVLLWPMVWEGKDWRDLGRSGIDNEIAERIPVCLRAQLLDEVIDSLADYVEARALPSKQAAIQVVKRKRHEEALERYRSSRFG